MNQLPTTIDSISRLALLTLMATYLAGCDRPTPPASFEPNLVHAMKYHVGETEFPYEKEVMEQASRDATWVVKTMFGTPDEPKLPAVVSEDEQLASLVSMDHLMRASGPEDEEGRGLFRKHCVLCHGLTGNGRGRTAAEQVPYPRDYRMGTFKFKSTPIGKKPTREDLVKLIQHGIGGTAMKPIPELTDQDIQALVDYVIYLSWRGQHEREQIDAAVINERKYLDEGERLIDSDFGRKYFANPAFEEKYETTTDDEERERYEQFLDDWDFAERLAAKIGKSWLEAEEEAIEVPEPPSDLPIAESYADVLAFRDSDKAEVFNASVERGKEIFQGEIAACYKCHGKEGLGNGQTTDYDAWTKDWTVNVGLKPEDRESQIPLLARGALAPRNALPRNFAEGIFRGGSTSQDLYLRIKLGIDGTPMPAAPSFIEGKFEPKDIWHLINFIRSLQTEELESAGEPTAPATVQT